jgi:cyclase
MVVAVDVKKVGDEYALYHSNARERFDVPLERWTREVVARGAGELFVNSIDRDGKANGYDIDLLRRVVDLVDVPVIACGGAGCFDDFIEVMEHTNVSAVAAGNIFNFTENAYSRAKASLRRAGMNVR